MFLQVKTKRALVEEEMLPNYFYTEEELKDIKALDDFYSWSIGGYYRLVYKPVIEDPSSEKTKASWDIL